MFDTRIWWTIAWRNLWRHPRRTLITAAALAFGYAASVLMIGISQGVVEEMVESGTLVFSSHIQVQDPDYRAEHSLYETLGGRDGMDVADLLRTIDGTPGVVAAAPRVYGGGLASAGEETIAAFLVGIDPDREREATRLLEALGEGTLPRAGAGEVLLGSEAARQLGVGPGSELVLVAPAADGSLGNDLYTVSGVFRTGLAGLDAAYILLRVEDAQRLLALDPARIHEVAVRTAGAWAAPDVARSLSRLTLPGSDSDPGVDAVPWTDFRAELREYALLAESGNAIILVIVFGMAVFGVANTMLMATAERRREFAVVRALGTKPGNVAGTVLREGLVLGVVSLAVGLAVALPLSFWWAAHPPNLARWFGDFTMAGSLVEPILRVKVTPTGPVLSGIALLLTALLASVYPAFRSGRVPPADALADR